MRGLGLLVCGAVMALGPACSKSTDSSVLDPLDLKGPEAVEGETGFDKNDLVDAPSFKDSLGISEEQIEKFLDKTPYNRPSFLETYESNGVKASAAIAQAARTYHLNPLVFLVYAEMTQGLVAQPNYPFPPARIEYLFRCGCTTGSTCAPELAGFDRQVDCLGRWFRDALDQIASPDGFTASGWGPNIPLKTLDAVEVAPVSDATAAVYDRTPRVDENSAGGSWLFWNLWHLYSTGIEYGGPIGGDDGAGGAMGDACQTPDNCGYSDAICADETDYPGGACTATCTDVCPTNKKPSYCVSFKGQGGFCFPECNTDASNCREGYTCVNLAGVAGSSPASKTVCIPSGVKPGG